MNGETLHVRREGPGNGSFIQVNRARIIIFPSSLHRNTCLTVLSERGKVDLSNYPCCWELVLSVHASLTRIEVCNLFPSCVIQCGAALCSPEEHKQLPAPLIHTGALNSFYAQRPTPILRRGIICMYLPAARLISLADLLCIHAASSHIVLPLSDDIRWLSGYCNARAIAVKCCSCTLPLLVCGWLVIGASCQKFSQFLLLTKKGSRREVKVLACVVFCTSQKADHISSVAFCHLTDVASFFPPSLPPISVFWNNRNH